LLAAPDGGSLPSFEPGAHLRVYLPGGGSRSYSLIAFDNQTHEPTAYRIAVLLEENGQGGSRYMHALRAGAELRASQPANHFPLRRTAAPPLLLAGGIGITPIISMAVALRCRNERFELHYTARTRARLAFLPELERLAGGAMTVHCDDEISRLDLPRILADLSRQQPIYVCGPSGLIDATIAEAIARGWPSEHILYERFAPLTGASEAFEVELRSSGLTFTVPPDQTILDVLIAAGLDPLHDCRRGDCGVCQVGVIEGEPDHRDCFLSDAEKASNGVTQICVSRSKSKRLVLDL
jgi:ferredoxin-NADP reductase